MNMRIDKRGLINNITAWDGFLKRKVHLIACGGTALTLIGVKPSTKDIDLLVPNVEEYDYLIKTLQQLGYTSASGWGWKRGGGFVFDLFRGNSVHTTELLESPLEEGNHMLVKEFERIYLGVLNYYDIIISKLFRASSVDIEDCLVLMRSKHNKIELQHLRQRFRDTASYDVSEVSVMKNFEHFLNIVKREAWYHEKG